jgi:hypothetical protein
MNFLVNYLKEQESAAIPSRPLYKGYRVEDLFGIKAEEIWECSDCGNVRRNDYYLGGGCGITLGIEIPARGRPLETYLQELFAGDRRPVRCDPEACRTKHGYDEAGVLVKTKHLSARKRRTFSAVTRETKKILTQTPQILVIQLNRGNFNGDKYREDVAYEEFLDLSEFQAEGVEDTLLYRLDSVVAHNGERLDAGHYVAAVRNHNGKTFCTISDDTGIGKQRRGHFEELQRPSVRDNPVCDLYILFYSRVVGGETEKASGGVKGKGKGKGKA